MSRPTRSAVPDLLADPFAERESLPHTARHALLGADFRFASNDRALIGLVRSAYAGLPRQRLPGRATRLDVRLLALPPGRRPRRGEPAPVAMLSGPRMLGGASATSDAVLICPDLGAALVLASQRMLRSPYHARYELIEFAVFTLASRALGLVSLHAACIGRAGRGILLMGASGAGKSTVTLLALTRGFAMLAEDSVFATPRTLIATGVPNFLHARADSLRWLSAAESAALRRSPVIRRRSGVAKYELDLRGSRYAAAGSALEIAAVVFLSARGAARARARRLPRDELRARLAVAQNYAAGQAGWPEFSRAAARVGGFEIERGRHPLETVDLLEKLLMGGAP